MERSGIVTTIICDVEDCPYCKDEVCIKHMVDVDDNGQCTEYNR